MSGEEDLRMGVPRLLALAHVSAAHLSRSMRRYHDMTPSEFIAGLRLRHAAMLLATTTRPVADIAHACGFVSPSYFTRRFREAHGVTPREFRHTAQHAFVPQ
jgi:transcriptional regulator GlxA family with amidase domain